MVFQDIQQKVLFRIHNNPDSPAVKHLHDALIDILVNAGRNASGKHQDIPLFQMGQLFKKHLYIPGRYLRAHAVDFAFFI